MKLLISRFPYYFAPLLLVFSVLIYCHILHMRYLFALGNFGKRAFQHEWAQLKKKIGSGTACQNFCPSHFVRNILIRCIHFLYYITKDCYIIADVRYITHTTCGYVKESRGDKNYKAKKMYFQCTDVLSSYTFFFECKFLSSLDRVLSYNFIPQPTSTLLSLFLMLLYINTANKLLNAIERVNKELEGSSILSLFYLYELHYLKLPDSEGGICWIV